MAGRKKRPVLYEVVSRSRRGRASSWRTPSQPPPTPQRPTSSAPSPSHVASEPGRAETASRQPSVRVADGRVFLALGWWQLTVIGAFLLAAGAGLFQAGRRSVQSDTQAEAGESTLFGDPDPVPFEGDRVDLDTTHRATGADVATPVRREPEPQRRVSQETPQRSTAAPVPQAAAETEFVLEPGRYYVLVQYFPLRRRANADAAALYLRSAGVDCVVKQSSADLRLFATRAFENAQDARRLIERVRELGREYARAGGGYDFAGCEAHKISD